MNHQVNNHQVKTIHPGKPETWQKALHLVHVENLWTQCGQLWSDQENPSPWFQLVPGSLVSLGEITRGMETWKMAPWEALEARKPGKPFTWIKTFPGNQVNLKPGNSPGTWSTRVEITRGNLVKITW